MGVVGNIIIGMRVDPRGVGAGLEKGKSQIQGFAVSLGSIGKVLAGAGVAVGVKAIADRLIGLHHASASTIDDLAKLSDRLGSSTEELSGLKHAANLSGVDFEVVSKALNKMGVNLVHAANGAEASQAPFDQLGLNVKDLAKLDRTEAFKQIADKLNAISNPAERAALAMDIFGKAGADLGPLLGAGSAGINEMQADAEKLGITFSRDQAASVEAANDAWTRIGTAFEGVGNTLAIELAPALTQIADFLVEGIIVAKPFFALLVKGLTFVIGGFIEFAKAIGSVVQGIANLTGLDLKAPTLGDAIKAPTATNALSDFGDIEGDGGKADKKKSHGLKDILAGPAARGSDEARQTLLRARLGPDGKDSAANKTAASTASAAATLSQIFKTNVETNNLLRGQSKPAVVGL